MSSQTPWGGRHTTTESVNTRLSSDGSFSQSNIDTHSVDLIEGLPLLVLDSQSLRSLDGPLHVARPHLQVTDALPTQVRTQSAGKLTHTHTHTHTPREEVSTHTHTHTHTHTPREEVSIHTHTHTHTHTLSLSLSLSLSWPSPREATARSLPRCDRWGWARSLRGDTGRWTSGWRGCSWGSRRSGSECGPGPGSPGTCCPR